MSDGMIDYLRKMIFYRLNTMQLASRYRSILNLACADCSNFDVEAWETGQKERKHVERTRSVGARFIRSGLFPSPPTEHYFLKPMRYLGCCLLDHGKEDGEIMEAIALLKSRESSSSPTPQDVVMAV